MILDFEGIFNIRDVGGICTADGYRIKSGVLLRSGDLCRATKRDTDRLADEYGIKTVIDLRDIEEAEASPDAVIRGAENFVIPALPPFNPSGDLSFEGLTKLFAKDPVKAYSDLYIRLAKNEHSQNAYRRFFAVVMASSGGILWHCRQGKDRTGVAAILLLTLLGVSKEDILEDYFETNTAMEPVINRMRENNVSQSELEAFKLHSLVMAPCIEAYFTAIEQEYTSVSQYIKTQLGVSERDMLELRRRYLV